MFVLENLGERTVQRTRSQTVYPVNASRCIRYGPLAGRNAIGRRYLTKTEQNSISPTTNAINSRNSSDAKAAAQWVGILRGAREYTNTKSRRPFVVRTCSITRLHRAVIYGESIFRQTHNTRQPIFRYPGLPRSVGPARAFLRDSARRGHVLLDSLFSEWVIKDWKYSGGGNRRTGFYGVIGFNEYARTRNRVNYSFRKTILLQ